VISGFFGILFFMWYRLIKQNQVSNVGIPSVVIEGPDRDIVEEALKEMQSSNPNAFLEVNKIIVDVSGGSSLGHVSSGAHTNIIISIRNIENVINSQYPEIPKSKLNSEYRSLLKKEIKRTIMHELGHVLTYNPEINVFEGHELPAEKSEQSGEEQGYY